MSYYIFSITLDKSLQLKILLSLTKVIYRKYHRERSLIVEYRYGGDWRMFGIKHVDSAK